MERKDLLEYLRYDADELFMSDLICRMSTYLSDEQIVDCLRPLAIQSLPPVNEGALQTAVKHIVQETTPSGCVSSWIGKLVFLR